MQHTKKVIIIVCAFVVLFLVYIASEKYQNSIDKAIPEATTDPTASSDSTRDSQPLSNELWMPHEFEEVGLKFSVPPEMGVRSDLSDDQTIFTFYVERSTFPNTEYYQLYGIYQMIQNFDPETVDIEGIKDSLQPSSVSESTISGYTAISGQHVGERARYVTFVYTDKGTLTLATSQPTEDNSALTAAILKTMEIE